MGAALSYDVQLVHEECYACGTIFAMQASINSRRRADGGSFWCPNGHSQAYVKSEVARLREQLAAEENRKREALARANEQQQRADKAEQDLARHRKRTNAGVCTCCNRTFQNLARHMKTKHKV